MQHSPDLTRGADALPPAARAAVAAYRARLADPDDRSPVTVAWAPGRINLLGEHTDYNEGWVLPAAIDRVVAIAGRSRREPVARCYSAHHDRRIEFGAGRAALARPTSRRWMPLWARSLRAVLAELAELGGAPGAALTPGFRAAIAGDVPVGAGMSSSAALVVAAATFAAAVGGPRLPPMETALLCQRAEQRGAGAEVGIMDQAISCLGRPGCAILLDCRTLAVEYLPLDFPDVLLATFDTRVPHSVADSAYNDRRRECREAVGMLAPALEAETPGRTVRALRDVARADLERHGHVLTDTLLRRARHVVCEDERVGRAAAALRAGEIEALGELLAASHASLRDDYAVSCPELDAAVEIAGAVPGVIGARMMGAGFGGSALILARQGARAGLEAALAADYPRRAGHLGSLHICRAAGGPGTAHVLVPRTRPSV